tara:strand:+ start:1001 stop:2476 length:1476 start_codon:yes stop_codon:yes gene_type:complete
MPKKEPYKGIRTDAGKAGSYDIVGQYDWTSVPRNSGLRKEAPSAYITAYELEYSQLRSFIDGYMNILSPQNSTGSYNSNNPGLDFYKGLYTVNKDPIARFNFPFFGDSFRSFSSEFADTFSPISQRGAQMFGGKEIQGLGGAAESIAGGGLAAVNALATLGNTGGNNGDESLADKVAKTASGIATGVANKLGLNPGMQTIGAPGTYIETPKFYQYSNTDNGLQIAFTLSNTLEDDSIEKNFKFICDFTKINRPFRYGPIGMNYPAIYNLVVPGLRYIQWASLENFEVSLLGNRRKIGNHIIPEAYVCQFTFRSLTVEPSNFIDEICEERRELGSFEAYTANQLKEELEFQKGRGQRERAFKTRSELAEAIDNRVSLEDDRVFNPIGDPFQEPRAVIIHGSGIGSVYHRNKFPQLYEDGRGGGRYTGVDKGLDDFGKRTEDIEKKPFDETEFGKFFKREREGVNRGIKQPEIDQLTPEQQNALEDYLKKINK